MMLQNNMLSVKSVAIPSVHGPPSHPHRLGTTILLRYVHTTTKRSNHQARPLNKGSPPQTNDAIDSNANSVDPSGGGDDDAAEA